MLQNPSRSANGYPSRAPCSGACSRRTSAPTPSTTRVSIESAVMRMAMYLAPSRMASRSEPALIAA